MLQLVITVGSGVAAGLLGRRRDTRLIPVALTFWFAQSVALAAGLTPWDPDVDLFQTLAAAALFDSLLGVVPLAATYRFCVSARRNPTMPVTWPGLKSATCRSCGQPLDQTAVGRCATCGASYSDYPPVREAEH